MNDEGFDWGIDEQQIKHKIKQDPDMKDNVVASLLRHFVDSFSEFLGRDITLKEINTAIKQGFVDDNR